MDADPVGYGIRNAVMPLNYFENTDNYMGDNVMGFSEVKKLFNEETFVPLTVLDPDRPQNLSVTKFRSTRMKTQNSR